MNEGKKDILTIKKYCSWDTDAYKDLRVLGYLGIKERTVIEPYYHIYCCLDETDTWCWEYLVSYQDKYQILCLFAVDGRKKNRPCALRINPWPAELAEDNQGEFNQRGARILNGDEDFTHDELINEGLKCARGHIGEYITDSNIRKEFMCFWYLYELSDDDVSQLKEAGVWPQSNKELDSAVSIIGDCNAIEYKGKRIKLATHDRVLTRYCLDKYEKEGETEFLLSAIIDYGVKEGWWGNKKAKLSAFFRGNNAKKHGIKDLLFRNVPDESGLIEFMPPKIK